MLPKGEREGENEKKQQRTRIGLFVRFLGYTFCQALIGKGNLYRLLWLLLAQRKKYYNWHCYEEEIHKNYLCLFVLGQKFISETGLKTGWFWNSDNMLSVLVLWFWTLRPWNRKTSTLNVLYVHGQSTTYSCINLVMLLCSFLKVANVHKEKKNHKSMTKAAGLN